MTRLNNMVRFITSVISGSLKVSNRKRAEVLAELLAQGFDKLGSGTAKKVGSRRWRGNCPCRSPGP